MSFPCRSRVVPVSFPCRSMSFPCRSRVVPCRSRVVPVSFHVVPMQEIQQVVPTDIMTLKILGQQKALGDCETIGSIRSRAANLQFRLTFTGERPGAGTARTLVAAFHQRDAQRSTARGEAPNEAEDEGEDAD